MLRYRYTKEFQKDVKKLKKRFNTLEEDLNIFKKSSLELFHLQGIPQNIKRIKETGQINIKLRSLHAEH